MSKLGDYKTEKKLKRKDVISVKAVHYPEGASHDLVATISEIESSILPTPY